MGSYLNTPCVEKKSEDFTDSDKISYGVSGMQGWRISMEDAYTCTPDLDRNLSLFGVYDGHGGSEVATYCALYFSEVLKATKLYQDGDYENALKQTFMTIDEELTKPEKIKELKVLADRNPEDGPPTEEDFKNKEEEETYDEDETKLLYEEATMSIEELLARYGNRKEVESKEKEEKESKEDQADGGESAVSSAGSSSVPKTPSKRTSNTSLNAVPLKESPGTSSCNGETDSDLLKKETPTKVLPKKIKPSSSGSTAQDESDSEEGFDSDEAVGGSSDSESESEEEDEEEEEEDDEDDDDDEDIAEFPVTNSSSMVEEPGSDSGTTAVVAIMHKNKLYVANAGDSRCVLSRGGKAVDMSEDHKPEDKKEAQRISAAGGHVNLQGRVNGGLNLSRAIGDHCYKANKELELKDQMITAMPDVQTIHLQPGDDFLVLACDGIWNVFSSQEVVDFVAARIPPKDAPQKDFKLSSICEELFDLSLAPDTMGDGTGCDNMTCIIVRFNQAWLEKCVKENPPPIEESLSEVKKELPVSNGSQEDHERGDEIKINDKVSDDKSLNISAKTECSSEVENAQLGSKRPRTDTDEKDSTEMNENALKRPRIENEVSHDITGL